MMNKYDSTKDTYDHIRNVRNLLNRIIRELQIRLYNHDASKLENPEKEIFDIYTPKLEGTTYGSDEYHKNITEMKIALDHHYANNRHHPEYFDNGIEDMNLIDLIEMVCDWKAASLRHADGDIRKSIDLNEKRFKYSQELNSIFNNTVDFLEE